MARKERNGNVTGASLSPEQIEDQVARFRQRLVSASIRPKPTEEQLKRERAERVMQRLHNVDVALDRSDRVRIKTLMRAARLKADVDDLASVYGYCAEIMGLCRTLTLGIVQAHPIPRTMPPQVLATPLPPHTEESNGDHE